MDQKVKLRALRKEDSELFYEWITDKELMVLNSPYKPVSQMEHEEWFQTMLQKNPGLALFVIEDNSTQKAIGSCQLINIDMLHRNAELKIRIGERQSLSKGMGSEAVRQLVSFGFTHLNLHRIYLHVFSNNERAIKSYLKCGFVVEGHLKEAAFIDGKYLDVLVMGILESSNE